MKITTQATSRKVHIRNQIVLADTALALRALGIAPTNLFTNAGEQRTAEGVYEEWIVRESRRGGGDNNNNNNGGDLFLSDFGELRVGGGGGLGGGGGAAARRRQMGHGGGNAVDAARLALNLRGGEPTSSSSSALTTSSSSSAAAAQRKFAVQMAAAAAPTSKDAESLRDEVSKLVTRAAEARRKRDAHRRAADVVSAAVNAQEAHVESAAHECGFLSLQDRFAVLRAADGATAVGSASKHIDKNSNTNSSGGGGGGGGGGDGGGGVGGGRDRPWAIAFDAAHGDEANPYAYERRATEESIRAAKGAKHVSPEEVARLRTLSRSLGEQREQWSAALVSAATCTLYIFCFLNACVLYVVILLRLRTLSRSLGEQCEQWSVSLVSARCNVCIIHLNAFLKLVCYGVAPAHSQP
jgi:hypothetical protein